VSSGCGGGIWYASGVCWLPGTLRCWMPLGGSVIDVMLLPLDIDG
jgi:hypothetical protein